jgi:dihydroneopterin aldolase
MGKEQKLLSRLSLKDFIVNVHLGVTAEERKTSQPVSFSVEIDYQELPKGCFTDKIEEADDYDLISQKIKSLALAKEYCLIEHLALEIFNSLHSGHQKMRLKVHKVNVPIENLKGGSVFEIWSEK